MVHETCLLPVVFCVKPQDMLMDPFLGGRSNGSILAHNFSVKLVTSETKDLFSTHFTEKDLARCLSEPRETYVDEKWTTWQHHQKCFNYSRAGFHNADTGMVHYYIAVLVKVPPLYCTTKGNDKVSWVEALLLCHNAGGHLPVLIDSIELSHFVNLLKFEPYQYFQMNIPSLKLTKKQFTRLTSTSPAPEAKELVFLGATADSSRQVFDSSDSAALSREVK